MNAVRFTGLGPSCDEVTEFLGGPTAPGHRWKPCTNDGGWIDTADGEQEFSPGDWIIRDDSGQIRITEEP